MSEKIKYGSSYGLISLEYTKLAEAIKKVFGLEISHIEEITDGYQNQVYKAKNKSRVVFIFMNKDKNIFPVQIAGYKVFNEHGIPVPHVIAYKENPEAIGYPTMILSSAEGVNIGKANLSLEQDLIAYKHIGQLLRKIHNIKLDGYGSLKLQETNLRGEFKSWRDYWLHNKQLYFNSNVENIRENELLSDEEVKKLNEVFEELSHLDFGQVSLLHRDVHSSHIFVTGNRVTGLIDLGRIAAGDPRYDIANSLIFQNPGQRESFKKGYGELANDPIVNKYLLLIAGLKIGFQFQIGDQEALPLAINTFRETLKLLI